MSDTLQAKLRAWLHRIHAELADGAMSVDGTVSAMMRDGDLLATVTLSRVRQPIERPRPLSPCDTDILLVLKEVFPNRLTTEQVIAALETRELLHGESTTRKSLARLVRLKKIESRRQQPAGYRLIKDAG